MASTTIVAAGGMLACAAASFFCALAESALSALGQWQARQLAETSPERGSLVLRLLEQPLELLATIALGNTLANGGLVALALYQVVQGRWPLAGTVSIALVLLLVGCEVVPKTLAVRAPGPWALRVARPLWLMQGATGWLRRWVQRGNAWLLRGLVAAPARSARSAGDEEYQELLELAQQQGTLDQSEKEIILQIISLDRKTARDVMKPLSRMAAIPDNLSVEDMIAAARRHNHRWLPMYDERPDTIIGVLNVQALLLDPQVDLAEVIDLPSFVPESMNLLHLLKSLGRQQRGLAIVLDEFGGTAGLVTMEDILEWVIGPLRDEGELSRFIMEKLGPERWRVNGTMRLDDFRREYPPLGEVPEVETVGGLFTSLFEVVPNSGDSVQFRGLRLTAAVTDERRVREVIIETVKP
jgi:CBS domain containing-hemolysin-like protein